MGIPVLRHHRSTLASLVAYSDTASVRLRNCARKNAIFAATPVDSMVREPHATGRALRAAVPSMGLKTLRELHDLVKDSCPAEVRSTDKPVAMPARSVIHYPPDGTLPLSGARRDSLFIPRDRLLRMMMSDLLREELTFPGIGDILGRHPDIFGIPVSDAVADIDSFLGKILVWVGESGLPERVHSLLEWHLQTEITPSASLLAATGYSDDAIPADGSWQLDSLRRPDVEAAMVASLERCFSAAEADSRRDWGRELEILLDRVGLGRDMQTLESISLRLGIGKERVRQLEMLAIGRMSRGEMRTDLEALLGSVNAEAQALAATGTRSEAWEGLPAVVRLAVLAVHRRHSDWYDTFSVTSSAGSD